MGTIQWVISKNVISILVTFIFFSNFRLGSSKSQQKRPVKFAHETLL